MKSVFKYLSFEQLCLQLKPSSNLNFSNNVIYSSSWSCLRWNYISSSGFMKFFRSLRLFAQWEVSTLKIQVKMRAADYIHPCLEIPWSHLDFTVERCSVLTVLHISFTDGFWMNGRNQGLIGVLWICQLSKPFCSPPRCCRCCGVQAHISNPSA